MINRKIINVPVGLGPLATDWFINVRGMSAGEGITGNGQVVYGVQPRWEARINFAGFTREQVLAWRTVLAAVRGRVNVLRVRVCDAYRPTFKQIGVPGYAQYADRGVPHSDLMYFSDTTGYGHSPTLLVPEDLERGDTVITIDPGQVNDIVVAGHYFSHDDWLYVIVDKTYNTDGTVNLEFEPPLRRDISAGEELSLDAHALMVLQSDEEGRMGLDLLKFGTAQVHLEEWIGRP